MGDNFFKIFFGVAFALIFAVGAIMVVQMDQEQDDRRAVKSYLDSKGKAPVPPSWRGKIGNGI